MDLWCSSLDGPRLPASINDRTSSVAGDLEATAGSSALIPSRMVSAHKPVLMIWFLRNLCELDPSPLQDTLGILVVQFTVAGDWSVPGGFEFVPIARGRPPKLA
ncbi:hypothetical protein C8Q79DRAFT_275546 [Trametes meyenii]|nr:hypothetical protein C8Q79DRAFT_275546 [Trametes meyenii]